MVKKTIYAPNPITSFLTECLQMRFAQVSYQNKERL